MKSPTKTKHSNNMASSRHKSILFYTQLKWEPQLELKWGPQWEQGPRGPESPHRDTFLALDTFPHCLLGGCAPGQVTA